MNLKGGNLKVADLGCGSGAQTLDLAKALEAEITAIDVFPAFLDKLEQNISAEETKAEIKIMEGSMDSLSFDKESFDIFWSEGAIYNIGFEKGVKYWNQFLKPGGFLAVTEVTWLTQDKPKEIEDFWQEGYSEIATAGEKIDVLENHGYSLVGYFVLDQDSWLKNYYEPMILRFESFLVKHGYSEGAQRVVDEHKLIGGGHRSVSSDQKLVHSWEELWYLVT